MADHDTAEERLEAFCTALEQTNADLFPPQYNSEDHVPFVTDMREVMAKNASLELRIVELENQLASARVQ